MLLTNLMCLLFILLSWKANKPFNHSVILYSCIIIYLLITFSGLVGLRIIAIHQQITYRYRINEISANKPRPGLLLRVLYANTTVVQGKSKKERRVRVGKPDRTLFLFASDIGKSPSNSEPLHFGERFWGQMFFASI